MTYTRSNSQMGLLLLAFADDFRQKEETWLQTAKLLRFAQPTHHTKATLSKKQAKALSASKEYCTFATDLAHYTIVTKQF